MRRFSTLGMMSMVGYVALAFAALTRPTAILTTCLFTLTIAVATSALLGAIFGGGQTYMVTLDEPKDQRVLVLVAAADFRPPRLRGVQADLP